MRFNNIILTIINEQQQTLKMKKFEKAHKNSSFGQTPSFYKKDSYMQDSLADPDCDFSDDLIDEFNGISQMPQIVSPKNKSKHHDSVSQVLKSIENIQNNFMWNNQCPKQQQKKINNKVIKNQDKQVHHTESIFDTGHTKSQLLSKCQSNRFEQNILEQQMKKQKRIRDLKQELQNKQMQECTFTPNCHIKDKKTSKRNLEQFLKNQYEHVTKIEKKRQDLKRKAEQTMKLQQSFRPKINKSPNVVAERQKNKKPAHERLYVLKDKEFKNVSRQQEHKLKVVRKAPSQNQLSINRPSHIQTKSSKKNTLPSCSYLSKSNEKNKVQIQNIQKPKNKNNQKYGAQKFIKQFCYVLQCINLLPKLSSYNSLQDSQNINLNTLLQDRNEKGDQLSNREFSHEQFNSILRCLGFLIYDENSQVQLAYKQRNLAFQGFQMLQQYGVNIRNVCIFLLSIIGIFNVNPVNFYDNEQKNKNTQFELDQKQGRKMQKYFDLLYRNRLIANTSNNKRSLTPVNSNNKISSSPISNYISPKHQQHTKQLASKYRTKMIERANQRFITNNIDIVLPKQELLTHEDLLVIDNLGRNLQIKKLREDKATHLDQQCTFHPKVNSKGNQNVCFTDRGLEKSKNLYEHAKSRQQLQRHNSSVNQNLIHIENTNRNTFKTDQGRSNTSRQKLLKEEIQRNKNNFNKKSFQSPKLYDYCRTENFRENDLKQKMKSKQMQKKEQIKNKIVPGEYAKDVDKTLARMALGRKQRQFKNKLLQRGEPDYSNKKPTSKSPFKSSVKPTQSQLFPQSMNQIHNASTNTFNQPITYRDINQFNDDYNIEQNQPFLVIDVNMGSQTKQIQFFTGDEKRVGGIVDQFCLDHDLDDQCKEQLLEMVEVQMTRYLNNFNVDSTED